MKADVESGEEQERTTEAKHRFLSALEKSRMITAACLGAGIDRSTYYAWRKADRKFREQVTAIGKGRIDMIEDRLLSKGMNEGDFKSLTYMLERLDPRSLRKAGHNNKRVDLHYHVNKAGPPPPPEETEEEIQAQAKEMSDWMAKWDAKVLVDPDHLRLLEDAAEQLKQLQGEKEA